MDISQSRYRQIASGTRSNNEGVLIVLRGGATQCPLAICLIPPGSSYFVLSLRYFSSL